MGTPGARNLASIIGMTAFSLVVASCSSSSSERNSQLGTSGGNPRVEIQIAPFTPESGLNQVNLCADRVDVRFLGGADPSTLSAIGGEFAVAAASGAILGQATAPQATYVEVRVALSNQCAGGASLQLTNANGSFSSADPITLSFAGSQSVNSDTRKIVLDLQPIVHSLSTIASSGEIPGKSTGAAGSFTTSTSAAITLTSAQTAKYVNYSIAAGSLVEAADATWTALDNYPVQLGGGAAIRFHGGAVRGGWAADAPWSATASTTGVYVKNAASITLDSVDVRTYGDGVRIQGSSPDFTVRGAYMTDIRGDCIENDMLHAGTTEDSLFDGCYEAFSAKPSSTSLAAGADGRGKLWTIRNSLVRLQAIIGVYSGPSPGHGNFFSWDGSAQDLGPNLALHGNVFRADQDSNHTGLGIPPGKLVSCSDNVMVWLGTGDYPDPLPTTFDGKPCFTITRDRAVWDRAVSAWRSRH
jgi:hypothetical protein